jgi:membrane-bound lytic murein transglycosylase D
MSALVRWGGGLVAATPCRFAAVGLGLLALALALPWLWRLLGHPPPRSAAVEVWTASSRPIGLPRQPVQLTWNPAPRGVSAGLRLERAALIPIAVLLAAGGSIAAFRLARARRRLAQLCRGFPVVKRHRRLRLCASDRSPAPFAAQIGGISYIVVPTGLLADGARLRLVLDHEAEHLRRGDLAVAGLLGLLRVLFFWNPALALWERALAELQDLACDRRVLDRRRITALDYCRCLLWAAETAGGPRYLLSGVRAMAASAAPTLRRRILMLTRTSSKPGRTGLTLVAFGAAALLFGTSWAVQGSITERKMTRSELAAVASRIGARSHFPLLVDDRVANAVTRRIASPEARDTTRRALARMGHYRPMIEDVFRRRGLPVELLGMALHESGFDNEARPNRPPEVQAAGIWQFIPGTARRAGLEVSPISDQRLEPRRATEAAASMLVDLHGRFGDWPLAIAAYNGGPRAIEALTQGVSVTEGRSRVLAVDNELGRYLPDVMAAIVLIENPALAD